MKKLKNILLAVISVPAALLMVACSSGGGSDSSKTQVSGENNKIFSSSNWCRIETQGGVAQGRIYITKVKSDSKMVEELYELSDSSLGNLVDSWSYDYKIDGQNLTVTADGEVIPVVIEQIKKENGNNVLVLNQGGETAELYACDDSGKPVAGSGDAETPEQDDGGEEPPFENQDPADGKRNIQDIDADSPLRALFQGLKCQENIEVWYAEFKHPDPTNLCMGCLEAEKIYIVGYPNGVLAMNKHMRYKKHGHYGDVDEEDLWALNHSWNPEWAFANEKLSMGMFGVVTAEGQELKIQSELLGIQSTLHKIEVPLDKFRSLTNCHC